MINIEKLEWGFYRIKDDESHDFVDLTFNYDSKRHKYLLRYDWTRNVKELTEKEGETIIEFLDWLSTLTAEQSKNLSKLKERDGRG